MFNFLFDNYLSSDFVTIFNITFIENFIICLFIVKKITYNYYFHIFADEYYLKFNLK